MKAECPDCPEKDGRIKYLRARVAELEEELKQTLKAYELRGKSLERPCLACGHKPARIMLADNNRAGKE